MSDTVFLVSSKGGYYEDVWIENIKCFSNAYDAEKFKARLEDAEEKDEYGALIDYWVEEIDFVGESKVE